MPSVKPLGSILSSTAHHSMKGKKARRGETKEGENEERKETSDRRQLVQTGIQGGALSCTKRLVSASTTSLSPCPGEEEVDSLHAQCPFLEGPDTGFPEFLRLWVSVAVSAPDEGEENK